MQQEALAEPRPVRGQQRHRHTVQSDKPARGELAQLLLAGTQRTHSCSSTRDLAWPGSSSTAVRATSSIGRGVQRFVVAVTQ